MRKRGRRSRLLLCLWPVSVDDEHRPMKKLKIPTDPNGEEDGDVFDAEIAKEKHQHRFPGALKSVMSDLFATKKLGSRRFRSISLRSSSSKKVSDIPNTKISKTMSETIPFRKSPDTNAVFKSASTRCFPTPIIASGPYCPLASSFSSNSCSVLRRNGPFEASLNELKQMQQLHQKKNVKSRKCLNTNIGLSLIALSLLVLVVWGKICAILCTSTWLLLLSASFKKRGAVKKSSDQLGREDVDSEEYKKRVIMEGLLDRNRGGISSSSSRRL
ncbi:hypothetical protein DCAR_0729423 [Daucus carota subsp. sativus]|uniref:Uncharacterized protein n=1 Tax=Daucus carota subsp. sativus TaxID=79200 RepID=A0A164U5V0_DAUCS|nr:hypothetical protein DCAR_0729423 [Daucus carota subsp. sativus]